MPATGIPAADIAQFGIGAIETAIGLINAGKTKREAAQLERTRPQRKISKYATDDLSLAESELATGMSSKAQKAYDDATSREFSSSLSGILKGGGDINSIGTLYGNAQEGNQKLAIIKDNLRLNQINNLVRAYAAMNDEEQKNFEFNVWNPFADKAQANAQARMGAQSQIYGGINTAASAVMNYGQGERERKMYGLTETGRTVSPSSYAPGTVPNIETERTLNTTQPIANMNPPTLTGWRGVPYSY